MTFLLRRTPNLAGFVKVCQGLLWCFKVGDGLLRFVKFVRFVGIESELGSVS